MNSRYHQAVDKYHELGTVEERRYRRHYLKYHSKRNSHGGVHRIDARKSNDSVCCSHVPDFSIKRKKHIDSYASTCIPNARNKCDTDSQIPKVIWCGTREGKREGGPEEYCGFNTVSKSDRTNDHYVISKDLLSRGDDDLRDRYTEANVNMYPIPRVLWRDFPCCMGEEYILSNHHHDCRENLVLYPPSPPRLARHSSSSLFDRKPLRRPLTNPNKIYSRQPENVIKGGKLWNSEERDDCLGSSRLPVQTRLYTNEHELKQSLRDQTKLYSHRLVGDASLDIHRLRLPSHLCPLLEHSTCVYLTDIDDFLFRLLIHETSCSLSVIDQCEIYAKNQPHGWLTELYSLTRQDLALPDIPSAYSIAKPLM